MLTAQFFPDYYYPFNIEISFPVITELFANFGIIGVIGMIFAGFFCGRVYQMILYGSPLVSLICIFIVIRFVLLFRNDVFNNSIAILGFSTMAFAVYILNNLLTRRRST